MLKRKNRSGKTSIFVANTSNGRFQELKTIDISSDEPEIAAFFEQCKKWIDLHLGHRMTKGTLEMRPMCSTLRKNASRYIFIFVLLLTRFTRNCSEY